MYQEMTHHRLQEVARTCPISVAQPVCNAMMTLLPVEVVHPHGATKAQRAAWSMSQFHVLGHCQGIVFG